MQAAPTLATKPRETELSAAAFQKSVAPEGAMHPKNNLHENIFRISLIFSDFPAKISLSRKKEFKIVFFALFTDTTGFRYPVVYSP